MSRVPGIVPVSDLRQRAASLLGRVKEGRQPVVITQRGRAVAILLSLEEYERGEHERALLRSIAQGETEIAAGRGYDLDDVLAEADRLLAR